MIKFAKTRIIAHIVFGRGGDALGKLETFNLGVTPCAITDSAEDVSVRLVFHDFRSRTFVVMETPPFSHRWRPNTALAVARDCASTDLMGGGYFDYFAAGDIDAGRTGVAGFGEIVGPDVGAGFEVIGLGEFCA